MKVEPAKRVVLVLFVITLMVVVAALITKSGEKTAKDERTPAEKLVDSFRTASLAGDERSAEEAYDALKRLGAFGHPACREAPRRG
jgi:outer membrane protein assembly factor BamD (BamD/ComL family)